MCMHQDHQVTMNAAAAKEEAAKTPKGPVSVLANACVDHRCLLLPSVESELKEPAGAGSDLAVVRIVRGAAAAVKQRSLQICAACMLTNKLLPAAYWLRTDFDGTQRRRCKAPEERCPNTVRPSPHSGCYVIIHAGTLS